MADKYAVTGTGAAAASPGRTIASVDQDPTPVVRAKIFDLVIGAEGTPADVVLQWVAQRLQGGGGTATTAVVPAPLDFDAPAANLEAGQNYTVEPVYTAAEELLDMPLNKRASFRWVASPGAEWMIPAVAADGIGIICIHASDTDGVRVTTHFEE